ncbi:MAG: HD domain-containing protein [Chloroflexi bacterium]|nr:HD domain-containing protein [Chloroflexota bacterium]
MGAQANLAYQVERLNALHNIDLAIISNSDPYVVLGTVLDQIIPHLKVDAATILLLNPQSMLLEYAAGRGFHTAALQHTHLRVGEGHAGHAVAKRRIVAIPDLGAEAGDFTRSLLLANERFIAYHAVPLIAKGEVKGVLELFRRASFTPPMEWLDSLYAIATQAAIAIDNVALHSDLQRSNLELARAYDTTIEGWSRALDLRDRETEGHTQRVTEMTIRLAHTIGMTQDQLKYVRWGALLHDIGKLGISDWILFKQGPLTEEEWLVMRQHPVYANDILSPIPFLRLALDIPYCHHERWDGTGYPRGMRETQIPLAARVFAVVDVWDALRSDRPYRSAWSEAQVQDYLLAQRGKQFDPKIIDTFFALLSGIGLLS